MDGHYFTNPLRFLVETLFGFYILLVMLRFFLQRVRADFYNPLSQMLVRLTDPALRPLRRRIPGYWGVDWAAVLLMWLLQSLALLLVLLLLGLGLQPLMAMGLALPKLLVLAINVFIFAIVIDAVFSWISPGRYNPLASLSYSLAYPILRPVRRFLPPIAGVDLSPMAAIMGLIVLEMLVVPLLDAMTGVPRFL